MATFKKNVHLGTKDPLWGTNDIADKAITEDKLADGAVSMKKLAEEVQKAIAQGGGGEGGSFTPKFSDGLLIGYSGTVGVYVPIATAGQDGVISADERTKLGFTFYGVQAMAKAEGFTMQFQTYDGEIVEIPIYAATAQRYGLMTPANVAKLTELEARIKVLETEGTVLSANILSAFEANGEVEGTTTGETSQKLTVTSSKELTEALVVGTIPVDWIHCELVSGTNNQFNVYVDTISDEVGETETKSFDIKTADGKSSVTIEVTRNQAKAVAWGDWAITGASVSTTSVSASGGSVTLNGGYATRKVTYNNGYNNTVISTDGTWLTTGKGCSISNNVLTIPANTSTSQITINAILKYAGGSGATKTQTFSITQAGKVVELGYYGSSASTPTEIDTTNSFEVPPSGTINVTTESADKKKVHWVALKSTSDYKVTKAVDIDGDSVDILTTTVGDYKVYCMQSNAYIENTTKFTIGAK